MASRAAVPVTWSMSVENVAKSFVEYVFILVYYEQLAKKFQVRLIASMLTIRCTELCHQATRAGSATRETS